MRQAVKEAIETVERAAAEYQTLAKFSRQPRFTEKGKDDVYGFIESWVKKSLEQAPEYKPNSIKRDTWLADAATLEPHWFGVVYQCVLIDSNRGWEIIGGRNQVIRYTDILRYAEAGQGWRMFVRKCARSFRCADMCTVIETGRDGRKGPLRGIFHVDPTKCQLTDSARYPLKYDDQKWTNWDFFRVVSMPSDQEKYHNLGYCATSRALEIARLLYAILIHDQEKAGARMPEGLLLLRGISQPQWQSALEQRRAKLDADMRRYFGGLIVLAGTGSSAPEANLIGLSQLPDNFDRKTFTDLTMYAYSLVVGMDPSEFWPVQYGALGRGTEVTVQHQKATSKGAMDFAIGLQDRLQHELPDSLYFHFEQRDEEGDLLRAEVMQAWAQVANVLYSAGQQHGGEPLLDRNQVISLLVQEAQLPPEWTDIIEDIHADDKGVTRTRLKTAREKAMDIPQVRRAIERYPSEPIVRYKWPEGRVTTLWESGEQATRRSAWRGVDLRIERQESDVLYSEDGIEFTAEDEERAIAEAGRRVGGDAAALMRAKEWPPEEERSIFARAIRRAKGWLAD